MPKALKCFLGIPGSGIQKSEAWRAEWSFNLPLRKEDSGSFPKSDLKRGVGLRLCHPEMGHFGRSSRNRMCKDTAPPSLTLKAGDPAPRERRVDGIHQRRRGTQEREGLRNKPCDLLTTHRPHPKPLVLSVLHKRRVSWSNTYESLLLRPLLGVSRLRGLLSIHACVSHLFCSCYSGFLARAWECLRQGSRRVAGKWCFLPCTPTGE